MKQPKVKLKTMPGFDSWFASKGLVQETPSKWGRPAERDYPFEFFLQDKTHGEVLAWTWFLLVDKTGRNDSARNCHPRKLIADLFKWGNEWPGKLDHWAHLAPGTRMMAPEAIRLLTEPAPDEDVAWLEARGFTRRDLDPFSRGRPFNKEWADYPYVVSFDSPTQDFALTFISDRQGEMKWHVVETTKASPLPRFPKAGITGTTPAEAIQAYQKFMTRQSTVLKAELSKITQQIDRDRAVIAAFQGP